MHRLVPLTLLVGLFVSWQPVDGQVANRDSANYQALLPTSRGAQGNDRMPDGSSRELAMVRADQEKSLADIARIKKAVAELEKDLSRSEFLVSLRALENAKEIEELAKDIQGRLKRRR